MFLFLKLHLFIKKISPARRLDDLKLLSVHSSGFMFYDRVWVNIRCIDELASCVVIERNDAGLWKFVCLVGNGDIHKLGDLYKNLVRIFTFTLILMISSSTVSIKFEAFCVT